MPEVVYWASPTARRQDGIPVPTAADAEYLRRTHDLRVFAVTEGPA